MLLLFFIAIIMIELKRGVYMKTFKVELKDEEMEKLEEYLKKIHLTKAQFLRYCIVRFVSEYKDKS